jgi:16S rRNA processing protein RimM
MDLVAIAKLVKTRGLRGELVADVLTDFPERWDNLENVIGLFPNGERLELKIEKFWFQKGRIILKFAGYNSVEMAEALRNVEVCVAESDAVELETDEFFDWQLEGCEVETIGGEKIGKVHEVMRTGGTEILVVKDGEKE